MYMKNRDGGIIMGMYMENRNGGMWVCTWRTGMEVRTAREIWTEVIHGELCGYHTHIIGVGRCSDLVE